VSLFLPLAPILAVLDHHAFKSILALTSSLAGSLASQVVMREQREIYLLGKPSPFQAREFVTNRKGADETDQRPRPPIRFIRNNPSPFL